MHRFFRLAAPACLVLLAILSWLPADEMIRTGMDGRIEHFIAYIRLSISTSAMVPPTRHGVSGSKPCSVAGTSCGSSIRSKCVVIRNSSPRMPGNGRRW